MKPRIYSIIRECVENGIRYGIRRAHKHTDEPSEDLLESEIHSAIMMQLDEKFEFEIPRLDQHHEKKRNTETGRVAP